MGSRDGPGADTRPTGMSSDYRGLPLFQPGQAQIGRSQAQIEGPIHHAGKPEIQQPSGIAGDGEARTRTGDTTIFSRARRSGLMAQIPGSYVVSTGARAMPVVRGLRMFTAVSGNGRRLRPRLGTRAVSAASGSEHARGSRRAGYVGGRRLARITLGRQRSLFLKAGTNAASAPTNVSPEQA